MNILEQIAERTCERVRLAKLKIPPDEMIERAKNFNLKNFKNFNFESALKNRDEIAFICECKKASPSKGLIAENFPYLDIAHEYEEAGASAISVLTEPYYFLGENKYLSDIASSVKIPCLRKDFVIDEYMIYEAKALGAEAVLLIVSLLDFKILKNYIKICENIKISALIEAHDENEIKTAINAGARIIGVNNRNLKDFKVDITNSERLRKLIPDNIIFIAESGIKTPEDIKRLHDAGVDAVLIGETLMKAQDKRAMLAKLKSMI